MVDLKIQLPEGFLDEEVRCGHLVTSEMKKAWAVMLDLLIELDRVCKKYNIIYYADGGTLLGAVRHKGFIPWDDDIDVVMTRDNYRKLCGVANKEFSCPYFFQTEYTDPGSLYFHAKLRNSETTAITAKMSNGFYKFNQGIFIDIFPLDVVPNSNLCRNVHLLLINTFKRLASSFDDCSIKYDKNAKYGKWKWRRFMHNHFYKVNLLLMNFFYRLYEWACSIFNNSSSKYWGLLTFKYGRFIRCRKNYGKPQDLDFEFIRMPVPNDCEQILSLSFGDWHKFVKGSSIHGNIFFDTENSYRIYIN